MSIRTANRLHRFFQLSSVAGILLFAAMTWLIITGEYASIADRRAAESVLNTIAIGGLIYSALCWMIDFFTQPVLNRHKA